MPIPDNYVRITGSEREAVPGARATAAADPDERIQVTVMVRPKTPLSGQLHNVI